MSEQMVNRLREELTKAHSKVREQAEHIDGLEKQVAQQRAAIAEASFFGDELSVALASKAAAEKQASAARAGNRKKRSVMLRVLAASSKSRSDYSQPVREEARQLSQLNARILQLPLPCYVQESSADSALFRRHRCDAAPPTCADPTF